MGFVFLIKKTLGDFLQPIKILNPRFKKVPISSLPKKCWKKKKQFFHPFFPKGETRKGGFFTFQKGPKIFKISFFSFLTGMGGDSFSLPSFLINLFKNKIFGGPTPEIKPNLFPFLAGKKKNPQRFLKGFFFFFFPGSSFV